MKLESLRIGELTAKIPVIQGGMGVGVSLSGLAGTVAACGGVGIISTAQIGYRDPEFDKKPIETNLRVIKEEVTKAKEISQGGIIGVNIMVATKKYEEYVKTAVEAGVDIIISGAGLPMTLPALVEGAKTKTAPIVSSLKSAQVICKYWLKKYDRLPDLVVIEGPKAGGHLGFSLEQLQDLKQFDFEAEIKKIVGFIKELATTYAKKIPVAVAGGIYTREDAEHAIALGADAVQMGTRFVTTYECDASAEYKEAYIQAKKEDIILVKSPVGMPGRALNNEFMKKVKESRIPCTKCHQCVSTCDPSSTPYCITDALVNAAKGKIENALIFCGSNAYRATKLESVRDIMEEFA